MNCKKCGAPVLPEDCYCGNCGQKLPRPAFALYGKRNTALSVILSVLLCFSLIAAVFLSVLHTAFGTSNSDRWAEEIELADLTVPVDGEEKELTEIILEYCEDAPDIRGVTDKDIRKLLEKDEVKELLSGALELAGDYALRGKHSGGLDAEDICGLIRKNEEEITEALGKMGLEETIDYDAIKDAIDENFDGKIEFGSIPGVNKTGASAVRFALSETFLIVSWALVGLWAVLLVLVNRKRLCALPIGIGIPALVAAFPLAILLIASLVFTLIKKTSVISAAVGLFTGSLIIYTLATLAVGVIGLVLGIVLHGKAVKARA